MVYIAMEPLQVVGSNHCLRAIWPLSRHRCSVVAGGSGWHLHKRMHSNSLSAVVVAPRATVLKRSPVVPSFLPLLVPDRGSDWSRGGRWLWPVLK